MILVAGLVCASMLVPTVGFLIGKAACRRENDRASRELLYAKQRELLSLVDGQETCCMPGELVKVNPVLVR